MATKNVTFDPDLEFQDQIEHLWWNRFLRFFVKTTSNAAFDLPYSGQRFQKCCCWSHSWQQTFTVGFTSAYDGKMTISLTDRNS